MNKQEPEKFWKDLANRPDVKGPTPQEFKSLQTIVLGSVVILTTIVVGFVLNYLAASQATYQNLVDKVNEQNIKVDTLVNEIHRQKGFR